MYLSKAVISGMFPLNFGMMITDSIGFAALQVEVMEMGDSIAIVKPITMPLGTDFWYSAGPDMQLGDVYLEEVRVDYAPVVSPPIKCIPIWRYIDGTSIKGSEFGEGESSSPYRVLRSGIVEAVHITCSKS